MLVANLAGFVYEEHRGDAAKFEQVPFLPVQVGDAMFGVGQAGVGEIVFFPIAAVAVGAVGAYGQDFRVTRGKGRVVVAQAREVGAAVWSQKAAQKDQDDIFLTTKV